MGIGFLYNSKDYKYPKGKLFEDQDEYDEALESGWDTGPADKAKAKKAKAEKETPEEEESKEGELPLEVKEKPKPKTRRRKK